VEILEMRPRYSTNLRKGFVFGAGFTVVEDDKYY
jgi:hypothetical protein